MAAVGFATASVCPLDTTSVLTQAAIRPPATVAPRRDTLPESALGDGGDLDPDRLDVRVERCRWVCGRRLSGALPSTR